MRLFHIKFRQAIIRRQGYGVRDRTDQSATQPESGWVLQRAGRDRSCHRAQESSVGLGSVAITTISRSWRGYVRKKEESRYCRDSVRSETKVVSAWVRGRRLWRA